LNEEPLIIKHLPVNDRTRLDTRKGLVQTANLTASGAAELEFDSVRLPPDTNEEGKNKSELKKT
jgi:hypothetical protein